MNRNDFFAMVRNKEPVKKSTLSEIYELVDMFPYFQSAHLLLLKGLNDNEDIRFNKQLRHSALHVADREILYYYLNPRLSRLQDNATDITKNNEYQIDVILLMDDQIETINDQSFYKEHGFAITEQEKLLELDVDLEEPHTSESVNERSYSKLQRQQSELIDKFIIANPRIEPAKDKSFYPVTDFSAPHLEESGGLVTETLARIYVNQEYYSKAISIYEKLSLKYPEKNSYFAAQIEKIKEHIKK